MTPACWLLVVACFAGCDAIPRDTAGSLKSIQGGELLVGVAYHPPFVRFEGKEVDGLEPELIRQWAEKLNARITWVRGSEAELVEALHRREVHLFAAGLARDTPYKSRMALTQPYLVTPAADGSEKRRAIAVIQGESALLLALDRFLATQDKERLYVRYEAFKQTDARP